MNNALVHNDICNKLTSNPDIKRSLQSIIWFGSIRNKQDVHAKSDCDLQIIFDKPRRELTLKINKILADYPQVDLSIMYMQDIFNRRGEVIFHDGTKSLFFVYVLATGHILYGRNVYADIIDKFTLDDLKPSLLTTIREYLSRLRVMAAQHNGNTLSFKKYSLKLFKDLLVYQGVKPFHEISAITNNMARTEIQSLFEFSHNSKLALEEITNYDEHFDHEQMAHLLDDYEPMIERLCNE